jgi:hypothetical protein
LPQFDGERIIPRLDGRKVDGIVYATLGVFARHSDDTRQPIRLVVLNRSERPGGVTGKPMRFQSVKDHLSTWHGMQ